MAEFAIAFAVEFVTSFILTWISTPDGPRQTNLTGFTADYGATIPKLYGPENRTGETRVIWATQIVEHKHKKKAWFLGALGGLISGPTTYTYSVSFAFIVAGNPIRRLVKLWLNKKLVYDAGASLATSFIGKDFANAQVYLGSYTQLPDPTMEADKGAGNVPAYRGISYVVIRDLQLANYGNAVPYVVEAMVEESDGVTSLRRVVGLMAEAAGIPSYRFSSSQLTASLRGFLISDNSTVADAWLPLARAYAFDAADMGGQLRFEPRGSYPRSTVPYEHLGGHDSEEDRPETIRFIRQPETLLPSEVTVTYLDPARDYQPNTARSDRDAGTANSNIDIRTSVVMTQDEAQRMADRAMFMAWGERQTATTQTTPLREDMKVSEVHAFATPTGYDMFRIIRRTRGANGVIELELVADRPLLYSSTLPGIPSALDPVSPAENAPINGPVFIEPPADMGVGGAELWIGVAGTDGTLASGASYYNAAETWSGAQVYVARSDIEADYLLVGSVQGSAYMGVLTAPLEPSSGATPPDIVGELFVDMTESGGTLESVTDGDAATGSVNLCYVTDGSSGEFLTFVNASSAFPFNYVLSDLYRGLHNSTERAHAAGEQFVLIDSDIFRFQLPADMIGVPLHFRFVQPGQALADATSYPFTPSGAGFGTGAGGLPAAVVGLLVASGAASNVLTWDAPSSYDNVGFFQIFRALGSGSSFGSASFLTTVSGLATSFTDINLSAGQPYTYFVVPVNTVGSSTGPTGQTGTPTGASGGQVITASENLAAGAIVNVHSSSGAKVRNANCSSAGKTATGFVLAAVTTGNAATVFFPGQVITGLSGLTPGEDLWLGATAGAIVAADPGSTFSQRIGTALTATTALFDPGPAV